jgi:hypothetical protein
MADKNGNIDKVPRAIAADIGIDLPTLLECIADFCAPDPDSRSAESDGRRLELLDPARPWGWRIVNHGRYREKARKAMRQIEATASGRDAERKRVERERARPAMSGDVQTSPAKSGADRLSDSDSDTDTDTDSKKVPSEPCPAGRDPGEVARVFDHWRLAHGHQRARLDPKRKKVIKSALELYSADDLCESISGYQHSPHHMGQNDRGVRYDDIELFLRDAKHIDAGLAFARSPPTKVSTLTRKIIANTEDWVPPEMRHGPG